MKKGTEAEAELCYGRFLIEAKWRVWRRKQYLDWLASVAKGRITKQFMDEWVIRIDEFHNSGAYMASMIKMGKHLADNGEASSFVPPPASSSSAYGSVLSLSNSARVAFGLATDEETAIFKAAAAAASPLGSTPPSDTVVSTAKSKKSKKSKKKKKTRKNKLASVAEGREPNNGDDRAPDAASEKPSEQTHGSQLSSHIEETQSGQPTGSTATIEISIQDLKGVFGIQDATDEEMVIVLNQRIQLARQQAHLSGQLNSQASHENTENQGSTKFAKSTEGKTRTGDADAEPGCG
jgi:hypothetical protein